MVRRLGEKDFSAKLIVQKLAKLMRWLHFLGPESPKIKISVEGLNYAKVDIHYSSGFHMEQLADFLRSRLFEVNSVYSYHWIYPDSDKGLLQQLLARSNFVIEKIPLSKKLGRYVSIIAKKL